MDRATCSVVNIEIKDGEGETERKRRDAGREGEREQCLCGGVQIHTTKSM